MSLKAMLRNLLFGAAGRAVAPTHDGGRGTFHLLLVSGDAEQAAALAAIAADLGWTAAAAATGDLAAAALCALPRGGVSREGLPTADGAAAAPAVSTAVILDRHLPGADWRTILPRLAALPHVACVLLASPVADEYLWLEVRRHGGDDVIAQPWHPADVLRVVTYAAAGRNWVAAPPG